MWDTASGQTTLVLSDHVDCMTDHAAATLAQERAGAPVWPPGFLHPYPRWNHYAAAFSPSGELIITGATNGTCKIWDIAGRKVRISLPRQEQPIATVTFSLSGEHALLGIAGPNTVAKMYNAMSGILLQTFEGHGVHTREY